MTRSKHSEDYKKEAVRLVIRNNRKTKQVMDKSFQKLSDESNNLI